MKFITVMLNYKINQYFVIRHARNAVSVYNTEIYFLIQYSSFKKYEYHFVHSSHTRVYKELFVCLQSFFY